MRCWINWNWKFLFLDSSFYIRWRIRRLPTLFSSMLLDKLSKRETRYDKWAPNGTRNLYYEWRSSDLWWFHFVWWEVVIKTASITFSIRRIFNSENGVKSRFIESDFSFSLLTHWTQLADRGIIPSRDFEAKFRHATHSHFVTLHRLCNSSSKYQSLSLLRSSPIILEAVKL